MMAGTTPFFEEICKFLACILSMLGVLIQNIEPTVLLPLKKGRLVRNARIARETGAQQSKTDRQTYYGDDIFNIYG